MRHMTKRLALLGLALAACLSAQNWPQWRGPNGDGTSPAKNLPVSWSETENVAWRVELPSWAAATPVIWGETVFVTSAEEGFAGHKGSGQGGAGDKDKLLLIALNRKDGANGNMYGIAFAHSNAGSEAVAGLGHQMLVMANGDTRSAIGDGIWTQFDVTANEFQS